MSDFQFLQNPLSKKWVILSPRRAQRPDVADGIEPACPFCPGKEEGEEIYRVGGGKGDSNWQIRVVKNKFPFASIHEVIVHSPDHDKNFGELPLPQAELIFQTYRQRYNTHKDKGQVYIFHNRHKEGGESLPHPHSQLVAVPFEIEMDTPSLVTSDNELAYATNRFVIFCPKSSQWPDEVWIAPKARGRAFGEITDTEIADLAFTLSRLIQVFDLRHENEFPFNFYIYPGGDWYLRIIPRGKTLGGFEIGTGIFINTQDPKETIEFIKEHFEKPDKEKIKTLHCANYHKRA